MSCHSPPVFFRLTTVRAHHVTVMWLLHGADDVVLPDQQKVILFFFHLSSEITSVFYLVQTVK